MSDPPSNEPEKKKDSAEDKQSVDLSELKSFSFGTQWTSVDKSSSRKGQPRREDRRRSPGGGGARKDRRPRRPAPSGTGEGNKGRPNAGDSRQGGRPPRRGAQGPRRGAPEVPYESSVFDVAFYPEDAGFSTIIKAMRANHLTYELFEVARTFLFKWDRFIASITRKPEKPGEKPPKVFISAPDSMPFETEEEALTHAATHNLEAFFVTEEIEVDPPSGSFPFVNRCTFTKALLGPPNYHRYEETLKLHHRTKLPHIPFEKLRSSVETVRDEEVVNEWLESMKKATRYTTKSAEGEEPKSFDTLEEALLFLRSEHRAKLVKAVNYARVNGSTLEKFPNTEAYKAVEGELKRQRKFPLETANAIRGRMRREKFSIYKKGSKGVTYVCSAKRHFRAPGEVMSPSLDRIIRFLEANPGIKAKEFLAPYQEWLKADQPETSYDEKQAQADLHWLIADGYVSHFSDDSLFAQPVMDNVPKKKREPHADREKPAAAEADAKEGAAAAETEQSKEKPAETRADAEEKTPLAKTEEPSQEAAAADKIEISERESEGEASQAGSAPLKTDAPIETESANEISDEPPAVSEKTVSAEQAETPIGGSAAVEEGASDDSKTESDSASPEDEVREVEAVSTEPDKDDDKAEENAKVEELPSESESIENEPTEAKTEKSTT